MQNDANTNGTVLWTTVQDKLEIKWLKCIIFVWLATIYYTREKYEQNENSSAEKLPQNLHVTHTNFNCVIKPPQSNVLCTSEV